MLAPTSKLSEKLKVNDATNSQPAIRKHCEAMSRGGLSRSVLGLLPKKPHALRRQSSDSALGAAVTPFRNCLSREFGFLRQARYAFDPKASQWFLQRGRLLKQLERVMALSMQFGLERTPD